MEMRRIMDILLEARAPEPETWTTVFAHGRYVNFGWNNEKNKTNLSKHRCPLSVGISVFLSNRFESYTEYSDGEEREIWDGPVSNGTLYKVATCWIDTGENNPSIRIISARTLDAHERSDYMRSMSMKEDTTPLFRDKPEDPETPWRVPGRHYEKSDTYIRRKFAEFDAKKAARQAAQKDGG